MKKYDFNELARLNAAATECEADIRLAPEHFQVEEQLPFGPDGQGGHVLLFIEKRQTNTDWLAKSLAEFAGVPELDVGYAGLKDRHAVTKQWFSVKMEGHVEPDWSQFNSDNWQILSISRHQKKLKRGVLSGNHFTLILSQLKGEQALWLQHLEAIQKLGVPNYFAEQRFGREFSNLAKADQWFNGGRAPKKRHQRSLYLSAARSWLFNLVLSQRVALASWNQFMHGDVMQLAGTKASCFQAEQDDEDIQKRLDTFDIHPTGPLWGRGRLSVSDEALLLEESALAEWDSWRQGLELAGLKQERRALRLYPQNFDWQFENETLRVQFFLPAGCYATAVLRELAKINDVSERNSVLLLDSHK